jgi:hypothetical protein
MFFFKTSNDYAEAGKMVRHTFKVLKEQQPIKSLSVNNLPETLNGIPVFRSGFSEGYRWLLNNQTSIIIQHSIVPAVPYNVPTLMKKGNNHYLNFGGN